MKTRSLLLHWGFIWMATAAIFSSCDDDEKPKTIPEVTTAAVTDVTATSATGGGEITSDGNDEITASGLVYSSTNETPTLSDSKTEEDVTDGEFTSELTGLTSGTTYHVRVYATNSQGTGYGEVVHFTTGNLAPTATNVAIDGTVEVDQEVTAAYEYDDAENDAEDQSEIGTAFQWYLADDAAGSGETAIEGATSKSYTIDVKSYEFKYLRVGVTPKSSTGTTMGVEVKSAFSQIAVSTTKVRFTYNGQEVAYGIITSPNTGREFLDRNLGAQQVATSSNDYLAYGDLFQWGRLADGHQLVTRTAMSGSAGSTPVNGTTSTKSTMYIPMDALYILAVGPSSSYTGDWRDDSSDNLWQTPDQINNPCPAGWHIPTETEWNAEIAGAEPVLSSLNLTTGGYRQGFDGTIKSTGPSGPAVSGRGVYWSSTSYSNNGGFWEVVSYRIQATESGGVEEDLIKQIMDRTDGSSCRCIKDLP